MQYLVFSGTMDEAFGLQTGRNILAALLGFKPFLFGGDM
jgi:hypothetical protein